MQEKIVIFVLLFVLQLSCGIEYNRQQQNNPSTDFLLHEAGGRNLETGSKRDYVAPQQTFNTSNLGKQDYFSQFPSLGVQSSTASQTLNPNLSNLGTTSKSQSTHSGKRDYVAPKNPSLKPAESPRVKDLINFYDNQNKDQNNPQKVPSYSSILQESLGKEKPDLNPATKPSYSPIVINSNKISTSPKPLIQRQTTPPKSKQEGSTAAVSKPGAPVLPSTLLNNNNQANSGPSDIELQSVSEELLRKDVNNAAKYITVNYQEKTNSHSTDDKAPRPLLAVADDVWNIATIQKFVPLLDNYERDTLVNEYVTPQERNEENAFMDAIMSTSVIRHLMTFLKEKGYVTPDPRQQRDFLKQLWFSLYSRGKGKISSSGFEHIFVSELKNNGVLGLHNWIYFAKEELANRVNYLGYMKYLQLNDKGFVLKLHFNQQGLDKPVNTMFIGTSPELEIALYTLCFVTRADNDCRLKLGNKDVDIVTHTFRYRSKNLIGSAYPQI